MNYQTDISTAFSKYGNEIKIISKDGRSYKTFGFIQPISYINSTYNNIDSTFISSMDKMYYSLIAKQDASFDVDDKVILDNITYRVIKCRRYIFKNKCVYKWAILKLYYPPQEDDFSDNI